MSQPNYNPLPTGVDGIDSLAELALDLSWSWNHCTDEVWRAYEQGYFRQVIERDGVKQALYPYNDPGQLPIPPLRHANGEWLRLEIALPGYSVWVRAWQVQVRRIKLYLLDSNDAANFPAHRGINVRNESGVGDQTLKTGMRDSRMIP